MLFLKELEKFDDSKIIGVDSPAHMTRVLNFDTASEAIYSEIEL